MTQLFATLVTVALIQLPAHAADTCKTAHDAYSKMLTAAPKLIQKNTGTVNVTAALGTITAAADWAETCIYLRDDSVDGEAAAVYSDNFTSKGAKSRRTDLDFQENRPSDTPGW